MSTIPLVMGASGPVPTSPATLRQTLINNVAATNPDYTANLPGALIEDIASTDTGALVIIDQARVDAINAVTPYGANSFVLQQLGFQFGIPQGTPTNTSVYVVFSGPAGYVIPSGVIVSDGTYQYILRDGGVILSTGQSNQLYAVANTSGTWAVPANSVTTIVSSVPSGYSLTVTNPQAGIASTGSESVSSYRSRILDAGQVSGQGTPGYIRTLVSNVPGVIPRLVSVIQAPTGWEILCGGGDTYAVANAIYQAVLDLSTIVGSNTSARNISATIVDYPNSYNITYVNPPQQVVTMTVTWNTTLSNFTSSSQVNQLGSQAIQSYINSIIVGYPINELEMTNTFQSAVASVLSSDNLITLTFSVYINGVAASPTAGTSIIPGDSESYFYASASGITVQQG